MFFSIKIYISGLFVLIVKHKNNLGFLKTHKEAIERFMCLFELRAKNAPICNSLPRHFYENLHEYFIVSYLIIGFNKKKHHSYIFKINYNMALKNNEDNEKKRRKFSNSDLRIEISAKNCITITMRPDSVFFL